MMFIFENYFAHSEKSTHSVLLYYFRHLCFLPGRAFDQESKNRESMDV